MLFYKIITQHSFFRFVQKPVEVSLSRLSSSFSSTVRVFIASYISLILFKLTEYYLLGDRKYMVFMATLSSNNSESFCPIGTIGTQLPLTRVALVRHLASRLTRKDLNIGVNFIDVSKPKQKYPLMGPVIVNEICYAHMKLILGQDETNRIGLRYQLACYGPIKRVTCRTITLPHLFCWSR